ncbi:MAG: SRPBCC family protein [Solirubrobacterales bacterium]
MQKLTFQRDFDLPPDRVFSFFAEHENLKPMFGAKVTRLSDGDDGSRNGVGSCRRLQVGPAPAFEETITAFEPNELIDYRVTKGSPLRNHLGELRFTPVASGTHLEWRISFTTAVPGLDRLLAAVLRRRISQGLNQADLSA